MKYTRDVSFLKKLRFIDYLIISFFVLGILLLLYLLNPRTKWINIQIYSPNVSIFQADSLQQGNFEKNATGKKIATIRSVLVYDALADAKTNASNNKNVIAQVRILAKINPRSAELEYKNKLVKIGAPIEFFFNTGTIKATVTGFQGTLSVKDETKIITVRMYSQFPWLVDKVPLSQENSPIKNNEEVAVLSKVISPAEITSTTSSGEVLVKTDPRRADVTLRIKVKTRKILNQYFFRDTPLSIGEKISFTVANTQIDNANISDVE